MPSNARDRRRAKSLARAAERRRDAREEALATARMALACRRGLVEIVAGGYVLPVGASDDLRVTVDWIRRELAAGVSHEQLARRDTPEIA